MQKAINIELTSKPIAKVLSIAEPSIIENNPTALEYILIDDYEEAPIVNDPALDINYPMYNKETNKFYWITINYQTLPNNQLVAIENLTAISEDAAEKVKNIDAQINPVPVTFEEKQTYKQKLNNELLAKFLDSNPMLWIDGEYYGITQEDQNELALNLNQYQLSIQAGETATLQWHPKHKACKDFTAEEFTKLVLAIKAFVYPYVQKCQEYKTKIFEATTEDELDAINLYYGADIDTSQAIE